VELGGKPVEPSGSVTVAPSKTTVYELTATGESGDRTTQRTEVTVLEPSLAQILSFEAKSSKIERGQRTTLSWTTRDAVRVELNGKPVESSGSITVKPSKTTDYHLVATAKSGAMSDQMTRVTVAVPAEPDRLWLVLSGGGRPLQIDAVREALAVGVDWGAIVKQLMPGREATAALDIPIGSGRKPLGDYRYDPGLAKKLLAEAGYPDGLEVYLYVDNQKMMEFGVLVAKYLYRVGVKAKPNVIPRDAARSRAEAAHQKRAKTPVLFLDLQRP
jgi:ABC-type transport system substrate-binding protein